MERDSMRVRTPPIHARTDKASCLFLRGTAVEQSTIRVNSPYRYVGVRPELP
jgi:hypothetical protein